MKKDHTTAQRHSQRGQSLVEVALFFPIFIILLAGLVEVSQLLVTQNRISSAARASTRFAANGGQDEGMVTVVINNVTQTLQIDPEVWDLWSIRATVNDAGNGINEEDWEFTHIYGMSNTVRFGSVDEEAIRDRIVDELQRDELNNQSSGIAGGLQIVGTYAIHDVDSILGLDAMAQLAGFSSLEALSIMRITADGQDVTAGCAAFPIAVHEGARSVTAPGTGSNPYPNSGEFSYPPNPPVYQSFTSHDDDVALQNAQEGDIFRVQNGSGNGNFGWLAWNQGISANANTLADSLTWPGNSTDYTDHGDGGNMNPIAGWGDGTKNHIPRGYIEAGDPSDVSLNVQDWVAGNTGSVNSNAVRDRIAEHVDLDRALRLVVWSTGENSGNNARYQISGFAVFRIIGYSLSQGQGGSWILAEFIRWDDSCGQLAN